MEGLFEYVLQKIQNTLHTDLQHSVITTSIVLYLLFPLLNIIIERKGKEKGKKGERKGGKRNKKKSTSLSSFFGGKKQIKGWILHIKPDL